MAVASVRGASTVLNYFGLAACEKTLAILLLVSDEESSTKLRRWPSVRWSRMAEGSPSATRRCGARR